MTPTAPELLGGCVAALSVPPEAEDAGAYMAGKIGVVAIIDLLCAQECATGIAVRAAENAGLRAVLAEASASYPSAGGEDPGDGDLSLAALDAANAALRRRLIALHEAVEAAGDAALDRRILALYRRMAAQRVLHLPTAPAA